MEVRDAVERDAPAMAALTDAPEPVLRNVVHERSVRVLVGDGEETARDNGPAAADDDADLRGFVSFDAREDAVFVTQFGGDSDACERLLAEPIAFARGAGLPVEVMLREGDDAMRTAVEAVGFDAAGSGPQFRGDPTRRYRYDPT
ncbi:MULTISPECIES: hypothetical protein [Halolamina]|uniref:N-acetyltransferase domain-containing protein n=1 Tax=Halolamina pelagica TaxID=699431 RepID=A0A1I5TYW6_9EURY|nr:MULTISPECIES: hypothetical protein [Halolamina]NHX36709.1 hypothetical protein [Halolamina sp. R1-12]SFP88255.1 hypothetical protein SAMN05216277_11124 [Halolamina pelagica]